MEALDTSTSDVWLLYDPLTLEEYRAIELPEPFVKSGLGRSRMDAAWFTRSPGATADGPLEERILAGRRFVRVARPELPPTTAGPGHPFRVVVHKHHVVGYEAGVPVDVLRAPDGSEFVHVLMARRDGERTLAEGWTVRSWTPRSPVLLELPAPTVAYFFVTGESFQGPVDLPGD